MVRVLLELGRVSNLPTVLSNCVAAWVIAHGAATVEFGNAFWWLFGGMCLMYVAGTALNDAFDERFDREHRPERPIPSGRIPARAVWGGGLAFLVAGGVIAVLLGGADPAVVVGLGGAIVFYDAVHKRAWIGPWVMGACRLLLFLVVASAAGEGARTLAVLVVGGGVGLYIVGLTYAAMAEAGGRKLLRWSQLLVFVPVVLVALNLTTAGHKLIETQAMPLVLVLALLVWVVLALRLLNGEKEGRIGKAVAALLAGLVLIDASVVGFYEPQVALMLLAAFLVTLGLQRFVPAT